MPKLLAKITDKKLQSITKRTACGGVPGLIVKVSKLQNGYLRKYFFLRYQRNGSARHFALGAYPEMSLAEAFKKAAEWRKKLDEGIDPSEEQKIKRMAVQHQNLTHKISLPSMLCFSANSSGLRKIRLTSAATMSLK